MNAYDRPQQQRMSRATLTADLNYYPETREALAAMAASAVSYRNPALKVEPMWLWSNVVRGIREHPIREQAMMLTCPQKT
ncbi:hypothetical protein ZHAS_00022054 [Anopheles sinensis]|uniref:Uncharacterized protein n=1 Tax=Anopheles sinensis TaxID=74873 RepID=A0A084WUC1_ANOSI|nr:hypothetical protein ZHAS_00022054 [Anopheles sinensis]